MTDVPLLICTDLDRTLIPNGMQPESPGAMELFNNLVSQSNVTLAFVTGRHRELVEEAIEEFRLPQPDYVIADVGTTIYKANPGNWSVWEQWGWEIGRGWAGMSHGDIHAMFEDIEQLGLQEREKQNRYKVSYYLPHESDQEELEQVMSARLQSEGVDAALVWSVDCVASVGLLDVLPAAATKQHAIEFLMQELGFGLDNTIFAGDSGNDISVLASPIKAILVANASDDVRQMAMRDATKKMQTDALYLAQGGFNGMNGNYSAGILEGVVHYLPQVGSLLRR